MHHDCTELRRSLRAHQKEQRGLTPLQRVLQGLTNIPEPDAELLAKLEDTRLDSFESYKRWLEHNPGTQPEVLALYDIQYAAILDERIGLDRRLQYQVACKPVTMRCVHLPTLLHAGHVKMVTALPGTAQATDTAQAWVDVLFTDTWEAADPVHCHDSAQEVFGPYMQRLADKARRSRSDMQVSNRDRQGCVQSLSDGQLGLIARPELAGLIHVDPLQTCNPDTDRVSTGACAIARPAHGTSTCTVHTPDGRTAGTVDVGRVHLLHRAFTSRSPANEGTFESALASLLLRTPKQKPSDKVTWLAPPALVDALIQGLQLTTELFSGPLRFHPSLPCYYSSNPADSVFGANIDPFSTAWSGHSLCVPPEDDRLMDKALRWAIASASSLQVPSLTTFILPDRQSTAYRRWIPHPLIVSGFRIPDRLLVPSDPAGGHSSSKKSHKLVLTVANDAAVALIHGDQLLNGMEAACQQLAQNLHLSMLSLPKKFCAEPRLQDSFHAPSKFGKLRDHTCPTPWRRVCRDPRLISHAPTGPYEGFTDAPLAWPTADDILYTDGSATPREDQQQAVPQPQVIGAGVYRRADNLHLRINPCGQGATNTITRAELVAISCALDVAMGEDCVIATDSKASMHMIQNQLLNPARHRQHAHRELLADIARRLLARAAAGHSTHIVKVKAHTGVHGNEQADQLANAARNPLDCHKIK